MAFPLCGHPYLNWKWKRKINGQWLCFLPGDGAELAEAAGQVVKDVQRPAVDAHGVMHVVSQV